MYSARIVSLSIIYGWYASAIIIFERANKCDCVGAVIGACRWRIARIFPRRRKRPQATGVPGLKSRRIVSFATTSLRLRKRRATDANPSSRLSRWMSSSSSLRRRHFQRDSFFFSLEISTSNYLSSATRESTVLRTFWYKCYGYIKLL